MDCHRPKENKGAAGLDPFVVAGRPAGCASAMPSEDTENRENPIEILLFPTEAACWMFDGNITAKMHWRYF